MVKLESAAIIRKGQVYSGGKAHWEVRLSIGDENPVQRQMGDVEGFLTSEGNFVNRVEAGPIALAAGQIRSIPRDRELLSADVRW